MSIEEKLSIRIQNTQQKIKEIEINLASLEHEFQKLLQQHGMTPEQLAAFTEDATRFSPPIWENYSKRRKRLQRNLR